jgi:hypothetical protein
MVNYNNGKIYKIEPISGGEDGDVYVGSTTMKYLSRRISGHRTKYKQWKNGTSNMMTSFKLFEKYGVGNCQISLLELVNVNTKDELLAREGFYIKSINCINKVIVGRTKREYQEDNRERIIIYRKNYYEENKGKIHQKCLCECGHFGVKSNLRHIHSKRHMDFLQTRTVTEST